VIGKKITIEKKDGSGEILSGDSVTLQAHTGKFIEVEGTGVQARFAGRGDWQTLVIEKAAGRQLAETSLSTPVPEVLRDASFGMFAFVIASFACATMALTQLWRSWQMNYIKVQPVDCGLDEAMP
jgi:hypothetical protein